MTPHKCPVCNGTGNVPMGFYYPYPYRGNTTGGLTEQCRTCRGSGIVWSEDGPPLASLKQPHIDTKTPL